MDEELKEPMSKKVSGKVRSLDGDFPIMDDDTEGSLTLNTPCLCPSPLSNVLVLVGSSSGKRSKSPGPDASDIESVDSDDGDAKQEVLKQIKFPEVEKDKSPASCVTPVCKCLAKQLDKVSDFVTKLEAIPSKNDIQTK